MATLQIFTIENNEVSSYSFSDRRTANESFVELKNDSDVQALATYDGKNVRFWRGDETDWFIPVINLCEEYDEWKDADSFELAVLHQWHENAMVKNLDVNTFDFECENAWSIYFRGKRYKLTEEFCKEDERMADLCGSKDKYWRYTFWSLTGEELSCYCLEA